MHDLLMKELKLAASPLSFFFILFGVMFFIPSYPILVGPFIVTLGIFYSFQTARESNDIVFSALLPIAKKDVVICKYIFVCFVEICAFALMAAVTAVRVTVMQGVQVYKYNALMNANLCALGYALLIFGLFNAIFVRGFFQTAYKFGRPLIGYSISAFIVITAAEALHHFPGFDWLNSMGTDHLAAQVVVLTTGVILYTLMTLVSCRSACLSFEIIDL